MSTSTPQQLVAAVRSKDPLRGLCETRQITKEACDWVKSALDPFHDLQLDSLRGYPDVSTEPTVVVKVRQAIEISAPAGLTTDANWDCHIALSPIDWAKPPHTVSGDHLSGVIEGYNIVGEFQPMGTPFVSGVSNLRAAGSIANIGNSSTAPVPSSYPVTSRLDGLLINSVPAGGGDGSDLTFTPGHMPATAISGYASSQINLDDYLDYAPNDLGAYRLIYSGFEVVNTTADIFKQGAVTVYEYGHSQDTSQVYTPRPELTTNDYAVATVGSNTYRCPPNTIAEAKIMPGAHTWAARDGCYCTAKFQGSNDFQGPTQRNYVIAQNNDTGTKLSGYGQSAGGAYTNGSFVSPGLVGQAAGYFAPPIATDRSPYNVAPAVHFSRMNTTGAYFTGLSPKTTLFVTWRVGIERLPAANKPTFLALAQPSAHYDPNALVLYNIVANNLPPGCPQGWNDLGKWYTMIANVAKNVIPEAYPLVTAAEMMIKAFGAGHEAVKTMRSVAATTVKQERAAARIQQVQKKNATKPRGKRDVNNFGHPDQRPSRK